MSLLLKINDLRVAFRPPTSPRAWLSGRFLGPTRTALAGVSIWVAPGEVVALLGANGAGKSTLLRVAAGLVEGDGVVTRSGRYAYGDAEARSHYLRLTVRENLRFFADLMDAPYARIDVCLGLVDLLDQAEVPARALSSGMLARVGLARALLGAPDLLLLDEVDRGLDHGARHALREALSSWCADGDRAALVATHDLDRAEGFTRAVCLVDGQVWREGPFEEVAGALKTRLEAQDA